MPILLYTIYRQTIGSNQGGVETIHGEDLGRESSTCGSVLRTEADNQALHRRDEDVEGAVEVSRVSRRSCQKQGALILNIHIKHFDDRSAPSPD